MAKNDERLIFGVGFDIATGIDEVIKQWEGKESKRLQKALDKKPLEVSLKIKKNALTELRDFIGMAKTLASAQRELNNVKKQEAQIEATNALTKERNAKARKANIQATIQEASREDQLAKKKADRLYSELKLADAQKNGIRQTNEQSQAYVKQSSYLQRLITRMAAYMSIHQILNWVQQIRAVTAEFELQRISLGALIQDAYKANTIFEQIKVQAVKSPYEVKDLVNYTKQLAAYGVEADDLMDTMNRLADISAGLGADMNRIILAYGQIQAAGVLKGTELRQLTELGIPMVELLAQYYSTLRSEVVSTSEVFDMISKKEVPFEAVKDILEDLTEEGGRFYDMQSVQAQTLQGQWTNMKDTLSIMFDEMGRTEEMRNAIGAWIESVKWLAENWRDVGSAIKPVIRAFLYWKGLSLTLSTVQSLYNNTLTRSTSGLKRYIFVQKLFQQSTYKGIGITLKSVAATLKHAFSFTALGNAAKVAGVGILKFFKILFIGALSNPFGFLMTAVSGFSLLRFATRETTTEMDKFAKGLEDAKKAAASNSNIMVSNFRRLVKMAVENADGSYKQREALRKLTQQYGDIFPEEQLRIDNLRKMSDETDKATASIDDMSNAIRSFNLAKFQTEMVEQYTTHIENQFKDTFIRLTDDLGTNYAGLLGEITREAEKWGNDEYKIFKKVVNKFLNYSDVKAKLLSRSSGINILLSSMIGDERRLKEYFKEFKNLPKDSLSDSEKELRLVFQLAKALAQADEKLQNINDGFGQLSPAMTAATELLDEAKLEIKNIEPTGTTQEEYEADYQRQVNDILAAKRKALNGLEKSSETKVDFDIAVNYFDREEKDILREFDESWKKYLASKDARTFMGGNVKVQIFDTQQIKGLTSLTDALKAASEEYKENEKALKSLNEQKKAANTRGDVQEEERLAKAIEKTTIAMRLRYKFLELFGGLSFLDDDKKDKVNPNIKKLENEVAMVEKIYKKYKELSDMYGDVKAREMVDEYFKDVKFTWLGKAYSPDELKAQLQKAVGLFKKYGADAKGALQNTQFKIGDIDFDEAKDKMEKKLKALSDTISRTKTAKEFFDRMLGMTGDKELSATLTMSVYGTTGDGLQKLMTKQILDTFEGVDISEAMLGGNKWDYNVLAGLIEKLPESQRQNAQSIVDNWRKANADIITDLYKTYEEFLSFEERKTKIVEKENAERMRIINSGLSTTEQEKLIGASQKRENKALADIAIEEFKASADWAKSFEDLEHLATPTIERLMAKLKEFIDTQKDLTPEQLKTLTNEYKKLYDGLIARNPFKAMTDGIKEYVAATKDVQIAKDRVETAQEELRIATERKAAAEQNFRTSQDVATAGREYASAIKECNKASQNAADADKDLGDSLDAQKTALNKTIQGFNAASSAITNFGSIITDITEILGIAEDSKVGAFIKDLVKWLGVMASVLSTVAAIIAVIDTGLAPFLAAAAAVAALGAGISWLANMNVRKAEKNIEALTNRLDSLSYAYDRLQNAQEKAFGTEYIQNYQRQLENLEAQQEAYLKQANLERSKGKKADEDKIKEYEEQARDAADAIKDMYGSLSENFLGSDLTSAARNFASAWIDAYKEFSNTTDAMKEKFQDMVQNMVVESLLAKVMEKALEPVFTMIDEMQEGDFYSPNFWQGVMSSMQTATENGVVGAENIMSMLEQMGINLRGLGGEMTGISRDIATASEDSILGLAAGINTQNFYISQVPTKLDTIIGLLRGDGAMPQGSAMTLQDVMIAQNQFLSHLPTIAQHTAETVAECKAIVVETRRTADALERVIKPDGTRTTYKMNVVTSYQG